MSDHPAAIHDVAAARARLTEAIGNVWHDWTDEMVGAAVYAVEAVTGNLRRPDPEPEPAHDGEDLAPADEPEPIEPGHIVELDERWMSAIVGSAPPVTRGTVQATTDRTAVVRVVIPVTVEVPLSDLRRCD